MFAAKVSSPTSAATTASFTSQRFPPAHKPLGALPSLSRARAPLVQAKLVVGAVNDPMEREADRVANAVMARTSPRLPAGTPAGSVQPAVQRCGCAGSGTKPCAKCQAAEAMRNDEEIKTVQRVSQASQFDGTIAPAVVGEVLSEPGEPLDSGARSFLEPRFGFNLSSIRIHRDAKAATSAASVMARAYTTGNHLVFGRGEYNPNSDTGRHLIAHEITHVAQQGAASGSALRQVLQRQPVTGSPPPGVPAEKWSDSAEASYRRAGLVNEANAVARCRRGDCARTLTKKEVSIMYSSGYQQYLAYNAKTDNGTAHRSAQRAVSGIVARVPLAAPAAAPVVRIVTQTALERAALVWGEAAIVQGGEATAAGTAAAAGAAIVAIALPVAVGVYVLFGLAMLAVESAFEADLIRQGFVVLPDILQVCIGNCHQPAAPHSGDFHNLDKYLDSPSDDLIRQWLEQSDPQPQTSGPPVGHVQPVPPPSPHAPPLPKPKPKKDDDKEDCELKQRLTPRGQKKGDYPLSQIICEKASNDSPSYDIISQVGVAEIDALRGNTWYECKCGYVSSVRAYNKGMPWAKAAMEGGKRDNSRLGMFEEILRHMRIAAHCNLSYRVVVASEEVASFFRQQFPSLTVIVLDFEPCEQ